MFFHPVYLFDYNFNNTFSVKSFLTPPLWRQNSGVKIQVFLGKTKFNSLHVENATLVPCKKTCRKSCQLKSLVLHFGPPWFPLRTLWSNKKEIKWNIENKTSATHTKSKTPQGTNLGALLLSLSRTQHFSVPTLNVKHTIPGNSATDLPLRQSR